MHKKIRGYIQQKEDYLIQLDRMNRSLKNESFSSPFTFGKDDTYPSPDQNDDRASVYVKREFYSPTAAAQVGGAQSQNKSNHGTGTDDTSFGMPDDEYTTEEKMMEDHTYPSPSQDNFQEAVYVKRDFYIHSIPYRKELDSYEDIKEFRDDKCGREFKLSETQTLLSNFINPNTPYRGVLIYHGTGVGKTCAAVAIGEKFKPMVEKYGTRIHVLVPGPLNKASFINEILKCTGETYMKFYQDKTFVIDEIEKAKIRKNALNIVNQYYRIMSYRSFYKKVLGEKIREKVITGDKIKISNRKTDSGDYERDISVDRIYNLNNSLLIVDEAHNLTGNEYGDAVRKMAETSKNLKIVLLSATPMKNLADEIVELINYLRPPGQLMERDKIYTSQRTNLMEFKAGGKDYLRKNVRGYVSYLRGADPLTFAERVDVGEIPPGLNFTKLSRCYMLPFQHAVYDRVVATHDDSLDRSSEAAANFAFPGLPKDKDDNGLYGYYGIEGINEIKNQLKNNASAVNKRIASTLLAEFNLKGAAASSLLYLTDNNKIISGDIFNEKYLKFFSIKFYTALQRINETVHGKRGTGLTFVYSNLVKVGIEVFKEVLQKNGYLEFQENASSYNIRSDTKCYFCGYPHGEHKNLPKDMPNHEFHPATYISITGKSDDNLEQIPEEKHRVLKNIFNHIKNKDGKNIKLVIGSKVMNEGITLENIKEIHILDVHYNLGRVDQVLGRGIRFCKHYNVINENNKFPKVEIYKYVISTKEGITTEEQLYRKSELKYKLVKETERILQEEAIDCPLNRTGNIFPEEIKKYGNCGTKDNPCPAICGYMQCDFKCGDKLLNAKYYDPKAAVYRKVIKSELDYSTYNNSLASEEIEYSKDKIKEMFRLEHDYVLDDILKYVKKTYPLDKRDMFDDYYVFQALNDLLPVTGNDFNNFHDTITDKFNRAGYLIYRGNNYIFQPFDEDEKIPMYYRKNYKPILTNKLSIKNYIQNAEEYKNYKNKYKKDENSADKIQQNYDFDSVQDYNDSRDEYFNVGTIDQETIRKTSNNDGDGGGKDVFKIRTMRPKILNKKRETGVPSFKGAVCNTSKDKKSLILTAQKLGISSIKHADRKSLCDIIKNRMFDMEKYATTKDKNKVTYLIVPANHPTIPFPLNLEDRIENILENLKKETRITLDPKIITEEFKGRYPDIKYVKYKIEIAKKIDNYKTILEKYGGRKVGDKWVIEVE